MALKIRIETRDGKFVSNVSPIEDILNVLADAELGLSTLTVDEDDTVRGWLLLKAEEMQPGQVIENHLGTHVCVGKKADGQVFMRDQKGEWPPQKPDLGGALF
jgi:hypothetical protein